MRAGLTDPHIRLLRRMREWISTDPWFVDWRDRGGKPSLAIESFDSAPWASLTFSGMRHVLDVRLDGAGTDVEQALAQLREQLPETDLGIAGHFLAEIQVVETALEIGEDGRTSLCLRVEALTIEE
ncbi:hypothetical protein [Sandaracinobacteroides hominis]|uniref:hypothetical protein n=1 Tax=Sandaracinobacteroides hominis TaxID=2780086 RepID=UPI0018F6FD93|nr:hypothetical protein [Sandaracinobacteroides hominis]